MLLGSKHSEKTKGEMSLARAGKPQSSKLGNRNRLGKKLTSEQKQKISETRKTLFATGKIVPWNKGKKGLQVSWCKGMIGIIRLSPETKRKMSESKKGSKNHRWTGCYPEILRLRRSREYKEWRQLVFERDKYTCTLCGDKRGGNLNADHIKSFTYYPDLRFKVSNGRTLCVPCHKKTPNFGGRSKPELKGGSNV